MSGLDHVAFSSVDPQPIARFFEKIFLDDHLAKFLFQAFAASFEDIFCVISRILSFEDKLYVLFEFFFPLGDLNRMKLIFLGNFCDRFDSTKSLFCNARLESCAVISSGLFPSGFLSLLVSYPKEIPGSNIT